jgi:phosphatidylinositol-bisphosphatase
MLCQIGTFNVATKTPDKINLEDWLKQVSPAPDVIALGFQELLPQAQIAFLPAFEESFHPTGSKSICGLSAWLPLVQQALYAIHGSGIQYQPIWMGRRAAIGMIILAKASIKATNIHRGSIGTGLLGFYANKGALGVSIDLESNNQTGSLCFIVAHLGPHSGPRNCDWRNTESDHILDTLALYPQDLQGAPVLAASFDNIWLFGDLNYRLLESLSKKSAILEAIKDNNVSQLLLIDELKNIKPCHRLSIFKESDINWLPSYKFVMESRKRIYNSKSRTPAYCDRILYKAQQQIICLGYSRVSYNFSDHDPICGVYHLEPLLKNRSSVSGWSVFKNRALFVLKVNMYRISLIIFLFLLTAAH